MIVMMKVVMKCSEVELLWQRVRTQKKLQDRCLGKARILKLSAKNLTMTYILGCRIQVMQRDMTLIELTDLCTQMNRTKQMWRIMEYINFSTHLIRENILCIWTAESIVKKVQLDRVPRRAWIQGIILHQMHFFIQLLKLMTMRIQ